MFQYSNLYLYINQLFSGSRKTSCEQMDIMDPREIKGKRRIFKNMKP